MNTYEIWGTYNGTIETLEQDLDLDEAEHLFYEYRTAFGNDWTIEVMEVNKAFGTEQGVDGYSND
jgi:hypothetical protein